MSVDTLLYWVGLAAVAVNALTGVLDSERKQMDLVGALLVGLDLDSPVGAVSRVILLLPQCPLLAVGDQVRADLLISTSSGSVAAATLANDGVFQARQVGCEPSAASSAGSRHTAVLKTGSARNAPTGSLVDAYE